jgi:hypothetical protein
VFGRIGELLASLMFGELVSVSIAVALFPVSLVKMEPGEVIVQERDRRKGKECREFADCLLLRHPAYFESKLFNNEFMFSAFNA